MSIAKLAECVDYITTIIFAFVAILFFTAVLILAIVWISCLLNERFNKARENKLFLKRFHKQLKAINDEAVQDTEDFDGEAPVEPSKKDNKKWYVYAENRAEIYGIPKGRDVKIGAFKTEEEAERLMDTLAKEGKWENMFVYPDDCVVCSETVRIELSEDEVAE
ncbi:MAG: hypothetical protein IJ308_03585 [Clostridia bacterium]|nr:hypothetical protein [Clostridia bacterium]